MDKLRAFFILTLFIFSVSFISAICEEGQIDINTASAEELDNIIWVGTSVAQQIIDNRPFYSLDDLDAKIGFIGPSRLEDIKSQNLACVSDDETNTEEDNNVNNETIPISETASGDIMIENSSKETNLQTINLNPQAIKSGGNSETSKRNFALYGLFAFVILLGLLFLIKSMKRRKEKLV